MPRNPKTVALQRGAAAERNFRAAVAALEANTAARKRAMLACVRAGCTMTETGRLFGVSRSAVANVVAESRRESAA